MIQQRISANATDFRQSFQRAIDAAKKAIDNYIQELFQSNPSAYARFQSALAGLRNDFVNNVELPFNNDSIGDWAFHSGPYTKQEYLDFQASVIPDYLGRLQLLRKTIHFDPSGGSPILPNGTRLGPSPSGLEAGVSGTLGNLGGRRGPRGTPSLPGLGGGLLGSLGGNRSGRGPGGSQYFPGVGFFPGAGVGPGGGVGHGIGGLDFGDGLGLPGGFGTNSGTHTGGNTGRQPGSTHRGGGGSTGYSEKTGGSTGRLSGGDVDRDKYPEIGGTANGGAGGDGSQGSMASMAETVTPSDSRKSDRRGYLLDSLDPSSQAAIYRDAAGGTLYGFTTIGGNYVSFGGSAATPTIMILQAKAGQSATWRVNSNAPNQVTSGDPRTLVATGFTIGSYAGAGAYSDWDIAEIAVWPRQLASVEMQLLNAYAGGRYGVVVA